MSAIKIEETTMQEAVRTISRLRKAVEQLLACPAIAGEDFSDPTWGCAETREAELFARAVIAFMAKPKFASFVQYSDHHHEPMDPNCVAEIERLKERNLALQQNRIGLLVEIERLLKALEMKYEP